jgi:hypothetical protein
MDFDIRPLADERFLCKVKRVKKSDRCFVLNSLQDIKRGKLIAMFEYITKCKNSLKMDQWSFHINEYVSQNVINDKPFIIGLPAKILMLNYDSNLTPSSKTPPEHAYSNVLSTKSISDGTFNYLFNLPNFLTVSNKPNCIMSLQDGAMYLVALTDIKCNEDLKVCKDQQVLQSYLKELEHQSLLTCVNCGKTCEKPCNKCCIAAFCEESCRVSYEAVHQLFCKQ